MISEEYAKNLISLKLILFSIKQNTDKEIENNKDDSIVLARLKPYKIFLERNLNKLHNMLISHVPLTPDTYVCSCIKDKLEPCCVFDDITIDCDKMLDQNTPIESKEKCPFWKKMSEINEEG